MPFVDSTVELDTRIGRLPGGDRHAVPQAAGRDGFRHLAVGAPDQLPVGIRLHRFYEFIGDTHGVVGVLARDSEIGLRIPVGVIGAQFKLRVTLARKVDGATDRVLRDHRCAGAGNGLLQGRVVGGAEAALVTHLAGGHDGVEVARQQLRSDH